MPVGSCSLLTVTTPLPANHFIENPRNKRHKLQCRQLCRANPIETPSASGAGPFQDSCTPGPLLQRPLLKSLRPQLRFTGAAGKRLQFPQTLRRHRHALPEDNAGTDTSQGGESTPTDTLLDSDRSVPPSPSFPRPQMEQLFSSVNEATLKHQPGSLSSAVFLVAGTTVGAGILAIPTATQDAGFAVSAATCCACWAYMVITGLLVAEVCVNTMCELGSGGTSLVSAARRTLGPVGVVVSTGTYVFIHYTLLVAYVARASEILTAASGLPLWASGGAWTAMMGALCYFSESRALGLVNSALVGGILLTFGALVGSQLPQVDGAALLAAPGDARAAVHAVPIIALAFVYQNVVPVIASDLEGRLPQIQTAILLGTSIPLVMFLVWDYVVLGAAAGGAGGDPLMGLRDSPIGPALDIFSILAIATSYIGFVLGLADFIADGLQLPAGRGRNPLPYLLTLVPPLAFALSYPDVFFTALEVTGTYGVLVLFGVIPAAMAWAERYSPSTAGPFTRPLVPGGRPVLMAVVAGAAMVVALQVADSIQGHL